MLRPVAVGGIEVSLRIQEADVHTPSFPLYFSDESLTALKKRSKVQFRS
jgi:hypothetical protein